MDADVVVIGAGAAGLAAARLLAAHSLNTIVLEARDRIAGRVLSLPSAREQMSLELGAEFIHGPARETMALLREIGSAAIDTGYEGWSCIDGRLELSEDFREGVNLFDAARTTDGDESVEDFLKRFVSDPSKRTSVERARMFVEGFDAADPAIASVRGIADEWHSGVDDTSARPLGGYSAMFAHLRDACTQAGVRIVLSTAVHRVVWNRNGVTVHTEYNGKEGRPVRARAAIVTLPVGVLRHRGAGEVTFEPELPETKHAALAKIEMGHVVKVMLSFRTAFWEELHGGRYHEASFFRCDEPFPAYWTQVPVRTETVAAWAGGPKAIALAGASRAELVERALAGFGAMFEEPDVTRREFEGGAMHDWAADPFARGAYSYVAVGGTSARLTLAEPLDDVLFFAGEATSNDGQGGTVNGALETGERAARELAHALDVLDKT